MRDADKDRTLDTYAHTATGGSRAAAASEQPKGCFSDACDALMRCAHAMRALMRCAHAMHCNARHARGVALSIAY